MIRAEQISKTFFSQKILKNICFQVMQSKSLVILGQSGVGKSVLLKILAGLLNPDQGRAEIKTKNIGMLFQKNALFDSLTVFENLEFPLQERTKLSTNERKEKINKFLEWVGLEKTEKLFPDELSGGMQKRLGIARALIVEPDAIFYDEPTAGLDPITSRMIADLILRLKKELGTTVIAVMSDVMRAYQLADTIGLLIRDPQGAYFLETGTPEQTRQHPNPAVQQFIKGLTHGPLTGSQ